MCPLMWAHWCHLTNTIELVLPSAHPSPQPKRQIVRFSHFCTAHCRKSLYFTMGDPLLQNCPFSWGTSGPNLAHDSLGHSEPTIQTASQSVQPFSHRWPQSVPILYNGRPFPPKLPIPMSDLEAHLIHDSLGPSKPTTQTASGSLQLVLRRWPQSVPVLHSTSATY